MPNRRKLLPIVGLVVFACFLLLFWSTRDRESTPAPTASPPAARVQEAAPAASPPPSIREAPAAAPLAAAAGATISGVVFAGGMPAGAGITVEATAAQEGPGCEGTPGPWASVVTAADGSFQFPVAADGAYLLSGRSADGLTNIAFVPVVDGVQMRSADLTLSTAFAAITGSVVDVQGRPVAGAALYIVGRDKQGLSARASSKLTAVTGEDGRFEAMLPHAESYQFWVCAPGYAPVLTEWIAVPAQDVEIVLGDVVLVTGTVTFAETSAPAADLRLRLAPPRLDHLGGAVTTGEDGGFQLELTEGRYAPSLVDSEYVWAEGTPETVEVEPGMPPLNLQVTTGASLSGTIYAADGQPLSGYAVVALQHFRYQKMSPPSDLEGRYTLAGVPTGDYEVFACLPDSGLSLTERRTLQLRAGTPLTGVDWTLTGQALTGRVITAEGEGVPGAVVQVESERMNVSAYSGKDGRFEVQGIASGTYVRLFASTQDAMSPFTEYQTKTPPETNEEIVLQLSTPLDGLIAGIVVDRAGQPLRAALQLTAQDPAVPLERPQSFSSAAGEFAYRLPTPGTYSFLVGPPDGMLRAPEPAQIALARGEQRANLRLVVPDAATDGGERISGVVVDAEGQPVHLARIMALAPDSVGADASTNVEGEFTLKGLRGTAFMLTVSHPKHKTTTVEGVAVGKTDVRITLEGNTTIAGRVLSTATGQPIPAFKLGIVSEEQAAFNESVGNLRGMRPASFAQFNDPQGEFRYETTLEDAARLICTAPGHAQAVELVDLTGGDPPYVEFRLTPQDTLLEGTVTAPGGEPVSGARLFLGPLPALPESNEGLLGVSAEAGRFQIDPRPEGPFTLVAYHPNFGSASIQVAPEDTDLSITLPGAGVLEGTATVGGKPLPGLRVTADRRTAYTDTLGRYRIEGLSVGQVRVRAEGITPDGTSVQSEQIAEIASEMVTELHLNF